ncbi:NADAR family protein [Candidatus Falkowbacteria bacterium]|nr:NADAR family protein [Candidatus Falkowbacteria bacterium]
MAIRRTRSVIRSGSGIRCSRERRKEDPVENSELRIYKPEECAVFFRVNEPYGGCSNMAGGFPLVVNDISIRTSEALYQACRFPLYENIQKEIIGEKSPMTAKMKGKPFRNTHTRGDWERVCTAIMRWVLRVKLMQNWESFSATLLETGDLPIVELSRKDNYWGTLAEKGVIPKKGKDKNAPVIPLKEFIRGMLTGRNVLGRLEMELRENVKTGTDRMSNDFTLLPPLNIPNFLLYGQPIREIKRP